VFDAWEIELHGHQVVYRVAGDGPPVVLIHGMVNASRHWGAVAERLAQRHLVIAPDLIGHGDSATPRGDYSLGAHASVIRDLLSALGIERATIVGHSLGGGIAMVFFWSSRSASSGWRWCRAAASATRSARCCAAPRCPGPAH
jgi:pimeloyl-ACP methyl ester carboxylesterase